ncbi:hypothetical protein LguiB_013883 [Lonicera macranthoides]
MRAKEELNQFVPPSPEASVITFIFARVSDLILAPGVPPSRVRPPKIFLRGKLISVGGLLCSMDKHIGFDARHSSVNPIIQLSPHRKVVLKSEGHPIIDLQDPRVQEIGKFAVNEHNKEAKTNLVYKSVIKGEVFLDTSGTSYWLTILTTNNDKYLANVLDRPLERLYVCSGVVEVSTILYRSVRFGMILLAHFPRVRPRVPFFIEVDLGLVVSATSDVGNLTCHYVCSLRSCQAWFVIWAPKHVGLAQLALTKFYAPSIDPQECCLTKQGREHVLDLNLRSEAFVKDPA